MRYYFAIGGKKFYAETFFCEGKRRIDDGAVRSADYFHVVAVGFYDETVDVRSFKRAVEDKRNPILSAVAFGDLNARHFIQVIDNRSDGGTAQSVVKPVGHYGIIFKSFVCYGKHFVYFNTTSTPSPASNVSGRFLPATSVETAR